MLDKGIIAVLYDADKTLIPINMPELILDEYGLDRQKFWAETGKRIAQAKEQRINLDSNPAYLNLILEYVRSEKFPGLSNDKLYDLGEKLPAFPGLPSFFEIAKGTIEDKFGVEGISVEQYIISSGIKRMIEGRFGEPIEEAYGAEFLENDQGKISEIARVIDPAGKRNILHQINKGCNKNPTIDVNAAIPRDFRRIPFRNMIYVADGASDIRVGQRVTSGGGIFLGVYKAPATG